MNRLLKRWRRRIAVVLLGTGLALTGALDQTVRAQDPAEAPAEPGSGSGRPFDGYAGTAILAFFALFIVGKSARR